MTAFKIFGRGAESVDRTRRVLGRACFLSGLDTVDFIVRTLEPNGYNIAYVNADKELAPKYPEACDYVVALDEKFPSKMLDDMKDGSVIFSGGIEKIASKKFRVKSHLVNAPDNKEMALLGGLTKDFSKVSIKSMKAAIEEELGHEKSPQAAFDEGYKSVK